MNQSKIAAALTLFAALAVAPFARAQDYPNHPVRIITDSAPGSAIDVPVRIVSEGLSRVWGQQAVVINQPGAGGAIAARAAATAAPDGYTLGVIAVSAFVAIPGSADNLPVQVPRDFTPVGYLGGAPMFIGAAPWLGVKTLPDLIAMAKQKPGELTFGVNGIGRLTHLTGELLQQQAGIKLLMVPYSGGTAQVINDMMGKRVALVFDAYSGIAGAVQAGNVIPLAVGSAARMSDLPNVPTVAETLPGFESVGWQVLVAPAGTPETIVKKANADLIKAMSDPEIRKRLADLGRDERPMSPPQLLSFIQAEQKKWSPIVQEIAAQTTQNK
ncbi:MAG TPA: tripartite tricarboxylate transporter substrate-binding protein [Xanthobacteraceae bacterium]|nr:tripartite tricarboxylate transporter substrate-binding protein [Xanthobacteraceae bacterium]